MRHRLLGGAGALLNSLAMVASQAVEVLLSTSWLSDWIPICKAKTSSILVSRPGVCYDAGCPYREVRWLP